MHTIDDTIHRKSTRETACTRVIMHMVQGIVFGEARLLGASSCTPGGMRLIRSSKGDNVLGRRLGGGRTGWRLEKGGGTCGVAFLFWLSVAKILFIVASCPDRWPILLLRAVSRVVRPLARSKLRNR